MLEPAPSSVNSLFIFSLPLVLYLSLSFLSVFLYFISPYLLPPLLALSLHYLSLPFFLIQLILLPFFLIGPP